MGEKERKKGIPSAEALDRPVSLLLWKQYHLQKPRESRRKLYYWKWKNETQ